MRFSWQGAPFTCGIHIVDAFANLTLSIEGSLFLPRCSLLIEERFRWSAFELESFESERYVESFELQTYSSFFTFLLKKVLNSLTHSSLSVRTTSHLESGGLFQIVFTF